MSIILDALKRAENERHLGELPSLHSHAATGLSMPTMRRPWQRPVIWLAVIAALVVVIAAAVQSMGLLAPPLPIRPMVITSPVDASPPAAIVVASPPAAIVAASPPPVSVASPPLVIVAEAPQVVSDIPVPPPLSKPLIKPKPQVILKRVDPLVQNGTPMVAGAATRPDPQIVMGVAQLPDNLQRELPPLQIGGSMYSSNPADRMLVIDKHLSHEGEEIAPGLVLESVMPKAAVLRFKGYRFRVVF